MIDDQNVRKQLDDKLLANDSLKDWRTYMKSLVDNKISKYSTRKPVPKK